MTFRLSLVALAALVLGCQQVQPSGSVPVSSDPGISRQVEHYFEPAEPPALRAAPPTAATASRRGQVFLGTKSYYAQTFTVTTDGLLSALQLLLHNQGSSGDFIVEFCKVHYAEDIPPEDATIEARITILRSDVPTSTESSAEAPRFLTLDLTPFHMVAKKGEVWAFRTRYTEDGSFGLQGVSGNPYPGGQVFQRPMFQRADGQPNPWNAASADFDLAFRLYVQNPTSMPDAPATQAARVIPTRNTTPTGTVLAESVWEPYRPAPVDPRVLAAQAQARNKPLDCSAVAFESHGRFYVQLTAFNASLSSRQSLVTSLIITVTPAGGGPGIVVDPRAVQAGVSYPMGMPMGGMNIGPNEGIIRTLPLGDLREKLPPGKYRVTLAVAPDFTDKTVDAELVIGPATTMPATKPR